MASLKSSVSISVSSGLCDSSIRDFNDFDKKHNTKYKLATIFAVTHSE